MQVECPINRLDEISCKTTEVTVRGSLPEILSQIDKVEKELAEMIQHIDIAIHRHLHKSGVSGQLQITCAALFNLLVPTCNHTPRYQVSHTCAEQRMRNLRLQLRELHSAANERRLNKINH